MWTNINIFGYLIAYVWGGVGGYEIYHTGPTLGSHYPLFILYNAIQSQGDQQLFLMLNPIVNEEKIFLYCIVPKKVR